MYYYDGFPLVHLRNRQLAGSWDASAIMGARAFAVDGQRALFAGSFRTRNRLFLLELSTGAVREYAVVTATGAPIAFDADACYGRGPGLYIQTAWHLYANSLADVAD